MENITKTAEVGGTNGLAVCHPWVRTAIAACLGVLGAAQALADIDGKDGASGAPPNEDCTRCHTAGAAVPTVAIDGPTTVAPGSTTSYTVNISGGPAVNASLGVAAVGASLSVSDNGTKLLGGEIVHSAPRPMTAGAASFTFDFVAPAAAGTATLYVAGMSDDGKADTPGDGTSAIVQEITIGVEPAPVNQPPTARITGPATGTVGTPLDFSGMSSSDPDGAITAYAWRFGTAGTAIDPTPTYTFLTEGTFPVTLTVTDDMGATDTATLNVTLQAPGTAVAPTADPGGPYTGTAGVALTLDGSGSMDPDGSIASYSWDFGDETTAEVMQPTTSKTYMAAGTYAISLTVTDNTGMTGTQTTTATIAAADTGNQPPVAAIDGPVMGNALSSIVFDGSGSTDADGEIVSYEWSFGDGVVAFGNPTHHIYLAEGAFTVGLTVTDSDGATATATLDITVVAPEMPVAPTANPGGPYTGNVGTALTFDGSASMDPDGTIGTYAWDFGDGTTGTGPMPTKTYTAAGAYDVTLTVTDDSGTTGMAATTATISPPASAPPVGSNQPPVAMIVAPATASVGVPVEFDGSQSADPDGAIASWEWTIGDLATETGEQAIYTFLAEGTVPVTLTVTDDMGATGTATINITLQGAGAVVAPTADPGGPYNGTVGVAVDFNGSRSVDADGRIASYSWEFGDGTTDTRARPRKIYASAGTYTVALTVTDNTGMTNTKTTMAIIAPAAGGAAGNPPSEAPGPESGLDDGDSQASGGSLDYFALFGLLAALLRWRRP